MFFPLCQGFVEILITYRLYIVQEKTVSFIDYLMNISLLTHWWTIKSFMKLECDIINIRKRRSRHSNIWDIDCTLLYCFTIHLINDISQTGLQIQLYKLIQNQLRSFHKNWIVAQSPFSLFDVLNCLRFNVLILCKQ